MTAHLICIKHWHSLFPEHVANSALAHACGARHSVRERSDVSTLPMVSQVAGPLTYTPSEPQKQGQVGIRHSAHHKLAHTKPSLGDDCIRCMWQWAPQTRSEALHETRAVLACDAKMASQDA